MDENDTARADKEHHYGLLAALLSVAVVAWILWLHWGAVSARAVLAAQAPSSQASAVVDAASASSAATAALSSAAATSDRTAWFGEMGQTGDAFGSFNALLTAVAGALVAWAGFLQHQSLAHARAETKAERTHRKQQEFESLFFQLIQLTAKAAEQIEGPRPPKALGPITPGKPQKTIFGPGRMGNPGINQFARRVFDKATASMARLSNEDLLDRLVRLYAISVFDRRPSQFGPYFRLLYQTFRHVAEAPLDSETERVRFANIARGQIPEGAVLLLALNGLTEEGHKFAPLIEKFGLLEHMHRRYKELLHDALLVGYRERAFLGSTERGRPGQEWVPMAKLDAKHFESVVHARKESDEQEDLAQGYYRDDGDDDIDDTVQAPP